MTNSSDQSLKSGTGPVKNSLAVTNKQNGFGTIVLCFFFLRLERFTSPGWRFLAGFTWEVGEHKNRAILTLRELFWLFPPFFTSGVAKSKNKNRSPKLYTQAHAYLLYTNIYTCIIRTAICTRTYKCIQDACEIRKFAEFTRL